jgi:hypothetical protein
MSEYQKKRTFPKHERDFINGFMKELQKARDKYVWFFKTHGEPMQARGIPDILMCYKGMFVAPEFKIMRGGKLEVTPYQDYNLELINKTGGTGLVIWWDERTGEVGVNMKRFDSQELAIKFLVELLDYYAKMSCEALVEFKRNLGETLNLAKSG